MGRSQRAMRDQAHYREDRLGDKHFPGNGAAAQGAVINPALKPGSRLGYIYDWSNTWPSGSESGQPGQVGEAELKPGEVSGRYSSNNGVDYWLSRSGGAGTIWYYWVDVDNTPGPDTKQNLNEFLANDLIDPAYRDDVAMRAMSIGWTP